MSTRIIDPLRTALAKCGKSAYRVAKDSGVQHCSLRRFLNGKTLLSLEAAERLAEYLGMEAKMRGS